MNAVLFQLRSSSVVLLTRPARLTMCWMNPCDITRNDHTSGEMGQHIIISHDVKYLLKQQAIKHVVASTADVRDDGQGYRGQQRKLVDNG